MNWKTGPVSLHTTELGDHGSRIVFCHGLFGQGRNWTQIGKALAVDHRVTLVDMPHHGRSSWPEDFDYLDVAHQVAGLLSADDPVTLVGHSMGGKAAMVLALRHPERVSRLCVVDMSPVDYGGRAGEFRHYIDAMQAMDLSTITTRAEAFMKERPVRLEEPSIVQHSVHRLEPGRQPQHRRQHDRLPQCRRCVAGDGRAAPTTLAPLESLTRDTRGHRVSEPAGATRSEIAEQSPGQRCTLPCQSK